MEIQFDKLLQLMWKKIVLIAALALAGAVLAFGITKLFIAPRYKAEVTFMVQSRTSGTDASLVKGSLSAFGKQVQSDLFLNEIAEELREEYDHILSKNGEVCKPVDIRDMLTVSTDTDAASLTVAFEYTDKDAMFDFMTILTQNAAAYLPARVNPALKLSVIFNPEMPKAPSSPSTVTNVALGIVAGGIVGAGIVFIIYLVDLKKNPPPPSEKNPDDDAEIEQD